MLRFPKFFIGTLVLTALFVSPALMGKNPSLSGLSIRQEVELEVFNLQKNLQRTKTKAQTLQALHKTKTQITLLRQQAPLQIQTDEVYMNGLVAQISSQIQTNL